jgi:ABC-type Fe3+-hydroxamate transport system substrate-binding protein
MVEETITDPSRIAALLRAEIEGLTDPPFETMTVEAASGEPGTPTFRVTDAEGTVLTATEGPERLAVEVRRDPEAVAAAAQAVGLLSRPKATDPSATVLLVERAADVKRVIDVLRASEDSQ